ncbi:hypothetical protein [Kingella sp. (in: b-proteobacteria)]|nr:hypothetical protein [Kingella sp. (in: b-proteobacteria)]MDO4656553.1 hypothetical protein [Kingella sp. (in: b-proteobacteria)]
MPSCVANRAGGLVWNLFSGCLTHGINRQPETFAKPQWHPET